MEKDLQQIESKGHINIGFKKTNQFKKKERTSMNRRGRRSYPLTILLLVKGERPPPPPTLGGILRLRGYGRWGW